MSPRSYFLAFVQRSGGSVKLSEKSGIAYSSIQSVINGHRGIGRRMALRLAGDNPEVDASILAMVAPTKNALGIPDLPEKAQAISLKAGSKTRAGIEHDAALAAALMQAIGEKPGTLADAISERAAHLMAEWGY